MRRTHRLKRKEDFSKVYDTGRSAAGRLLVLYALAGSEGTIKFGFAAGRKLGSAVVRNRAKRRMREIARHNLANIRLGHNLVLIARAGALKATYLELDREFRYLLRKLSLLYQE